MTGLVLSVVVPVYNVEPYLAECLESLAGQTRDNLEIIVVDDGSTDDSAAIAEQFVQRDPRFRLIRKQNAGLGAARNTGTAQATGEYLMFVDSDDVLPPYAAELLVGSLEQTGSDFSCGNVLRLNTKGLSQSPMHKAPFAATHLRTHVSKLPALLGDRTAWNKVYRRTFFEEHNFTFPEGVLYEDIPVTVPAHVLAKSVDVLETPVYYWREREGPDKSITQRREEVQAFIDRLENCWGVSRVLASSGQHDLKRLYDESVLKSDLMLFLRVLPRVDEEYQQVFLQRTNDYLDTVDPEAIQELPTVQRVLWTLVRNRMMTEILELLPVLRRQRRITRRGLRRYHDMDLLHERLPQLPAELFAAGTPRPRTKVHEVTWEDGKLRIRGHAFIPGQSAARPWSTSRLFWLKENGGRRTRRTPLVNRRCVDATADHGSARTSYDWSGFEAVIDPQTLDLTQDADWAIIVGVVGLGRKSKGSLEMGQGAHSLPLTPLHVGDVRVAPYVAAGRLRLRVERVRAVLTGLHPGDDGGVTLEGTLNGVQPVTANLSRVAGLAWRLFPLSIDGERFSFHIPAADLQRDGFDYPALRIGEPADRWAIQLSTGTKRNSEIPCVLATDGHWEPIDLGARTVHVNKKPDGSPVLSALPSGPVLTRVSTAERRFRFEGRLHGRAGDFNLVLRPADARETKIFPVRVDGDSWSVEVDPIAVPSFGTAVRMRTGTWNVLFRIGSETIQPLPAAASALSAMPLPLAGDTPRVSLELLVDQRVAVRIRSALPDEERGRGNQARLRQEFYPATREKPLRDVVLYNSFTGRQYSDSPRAVHEELVARGLPLEHQWVSVDGQAPLPHTAEPVPLWSKRWYEALATARYIVTNQHLPEWFRRREGQVVVQTWHGTPLKRIGFDIADVQFTDKRYLEKLAQETPNWTYLVSPNTFSSPILRSAFHFEGELLEIGYPRNDVLLRDRTEILDRVRAAVGIPADRKIVLYAPTWRDDDHSGGAYRLSLQLDVQEAAQRLGDDHVLLVRRHPNVLDEIPGAGNGFVYDVSAYPDMADLLAAADILITDYSSVMFDFAGTGRPILFFTYDLAHYRDELRGFYFDFEAEAPGPLLATSEDVIDAIRDVDAISDRYAERYRAFAQKASDLDDGHAAARLADRMLETR
ncbi:bifunctional glycosyltransferase family 2 protein/CDP-glycerol:glycerophosphate glycerophosphotransferase [Actinoplanes sp. TFC3]|uniref:bifunctional glycosyltransferase/CDP-glycerol:glycerophosphate glycerophosphotransferase n=1 Tax=Actinoplanes sp. TFC3 TaxID=1710355 RepID=UPI001F3072B9|nr:bifunctional glycosyltransferase family 2 protein/CDP-glycerol:glycerophosphate glycerophosphotransferase [Actinoplanes sp. TFC3]